MLTKVFLFVIGYLLITISIVFIILYLNLFNIGYNFIEYSQYINRRFIILILIIGIIFVLLGSNYRGDDK